jgi:hypothetical protein
MRDLITTAFEVLGLLFIAAAAGVLAWTLHPAAGLGAAGLSLLALSYAVLRFGGDR